MKKIILITILILVFISACQPKLKTFDRNPNDCESNGGQCVRTGECEGIYSMEKNEFTCENQNLICCFTV